MQSRMKNPALVLPDVMKALVALDRATETDELPYVMRELVRLRASQINGCSMCVDMHCRELKKAGESDQRIFAVAAWREAPYFSDAERAALALAEAATRLADQSNPVPDSVWDEAVKHFGQTAIAALVVQIGLINLWNRLNASTRQIAGSINRQAA
jgi:AhpD family alkylhydroperoxidase